MTTEEKLEILLGPDWFTEIKNGVMPSKNITPKQEHDDKIITLAVYHTETERARQCANFVL